MSAPKLCPLCHTRFDDAAFRFCPVDATPLVDASPRAARGRAPEAAAAPPPPPAEPSPPTPRTAPVHTRRVITGRTPAPPVAPPSPPPPAQSASDAPTRIERVATHERGPSAADSPPAEAAPAATFSETEWFRRPIPEDAIDPETGRVLVPDEAYAVDRPRPASERRGYSLEVAAAESDDD
jgi:hypothetical protein